MSAKALLPALFAATLLAACSSSKDASNSNFATVINAHYTKHCGITIQPGGMMGGYKAYPASVALVEPSQFMSAAVVKKRNDANTARFDALVQAGLLSVKDGTTTPNNFGFGPSKPVPAKVYSLTDAGKKALVDQQSMKGTKLCAGHYKVDDVVRFTPPASAMGATVSTVSYTFSPTNVPSWATSDSVNKAFPHLAQLMATKQKTQTDLVLASDGWIEASDFNQ